MNVSLLPITAQATDPRPAATGKLDINTATMDQLAQLAGIGPARAKDLVKEGRPYTGKDDLVKKKIIMTRSRTISSPGRNKATLA
ncbi:MAG: ComEA family DNA-binding protein [Pseudomonadota bacterium]